MSINQLDLGTTVQFVKTYLGPSLGWAHLPVQPNLIVTSAAPLTVPAFASRIVLNAAVKLILLPSIASWVTSQATQGQANIACFDRSLWIKDLIGAASLAAPIVVIPAAGTADTIDTLSSFSIVTPFDLIRLHPISDLSGWYTG